MALLKLRGVVSAARSASVVAVLLAGAPAAAAQDRSAPFDGQPLSAALATLQASGLRIVFSSEFVTPDLRVRGTPRGATARQVLDELLEPHGLQARDGPGGVLQVVPKKRPRGPGDRRASRTSAAGILPPDLTGTRVTPVPAARPPAFGDRITVTAPLWGRRDPGAGSEGGLGIDDLQALRGMLADDPMRAVQALPGVANADDYRSEFSVRGSAHRHVGVVIDGVATSWLRHAAYGRGDTGSLAMLGNDVIAHAVLRAGAYPRRDGDWLGAQLDLTLREGARDSTRLRGMLGGTLGAVIAEGPIARSGRGSWLVSLRHSYLDWPVRRLSGFTGTVFSFIDVQSKLVYDVATTQQVSVTVLAGRSSLDERDDRAPHELADGTNRASVVNVAWRSTLGSHAVLTQRASVVRRQFTNEDQTGQHAGDGVDRQVAYRADLVRATRGGLLEAGAQVQRMQAARGAGRVEPGTARFAAPGSFESGGAWFRSGYLDYRWAVTPRLTLGPGLRIADSTLVRRPTLGPWAIGEWTPAPTWTVDAAAGVSHQLPDIDEALARSGDRAVRPEQATHLDLGVAKDLQAGVRLRASIFSRHEDAVLRSAPASPEWPPGVIAPPGSRSSDDRLKGSSRGVELLVARRADRGLSGWVAYSYGRARYRDDALGQTFWADRDQRHALNASAVYRLSDRTTMAASVRSGTNFPLPGFFAVREGALFAGDARNVVRLPAYARVDVRAQRTFNSLGRRMTVFVEVVNVLNRRNVAPAQGHVDPVTGRAHGFTAKLLPRVPSAGVIIEF